MMTAILMERSCVGIDLKPSYTSEVVKVVERLGGEPAEWAALSHYLKAPNPEMEKWTGCLRNMRKPGSKPFTKANKEMP